MIRWSSYRKVRTWVGHGTLHRYRIQWFPNVRVGPKFPNGFVRVWEDGSTMQGAARLPYRTVTEAKAACLAREVPS